jgi:hypothetical protein
LKEDGTNEAESTLGSLPSFLPSIFSPDYKTVHAYDRNVIKQIIIELKIQSHILKLSLDSASFGMSPNGL